MHAASVYPEPGSNSPRKLNLAIELNLKSLVQAHSCADCSYHSSIVKVQRPAEYRPERGLPMMAQFASRVKRV